MMGVTRYPDPPGKKLTPEQLEDVTVATVDRLHEITSDISQQTWRDGMTWYFNASGIASGLARLFGIDRKAAAGVIAALSPRVTWEANIDDAHNLLETGEEYGYFALGANVAKALWLREGEDPEKILGGRKVRSFFWNIYSPTTSLDVTIDAWILHALGIERDKYLARKGVYEAIAQGFRIVADSKGLYPHQLQAAVWLHFRTPDANPELKGQA